MKISAISFVLITCSADLAVCQIEPFLDVTLLKRPKDTSKGHWPGHASGGCMGHGGPCRSPLPIKISIVSLDKPTIYQGEPITLEVRLENVGNTPVSLPWTVDWRLERRRNPQPGTLIVLGITPLIEIPGQSKVQSLMGSYLYGSLEVPGTYKTIAPGGTARFRLSAAARLSDTHVFPLDTRLRVETRFQEGPFSSNFDLSVSDWIAVTVKR